MAFCPNCGTQVAENVAFCPTCGKATGQAGAAEAAHPAPPPPAYNTPATGPGRCRAAAGGEHCGHAGLLHDHTGHNISAHRAL